MEPSDTPLTDEQVEQFIADAESATPGPWVARHRHVQCTEMDDEQSGLGLDIEGPPESDYGRGQFMRGADARHIANLNPTVAIPLLRELLALRAENARLRGWLEDA